MTIRQYILRRLALLPLIMLGVSVIVFTLTRFTGSPVGIYANPNMTPDEIAALEARYRLDEPIPVQYFYYLTGVLRGDLGFSGVSVAPVTEILPLKLAATLELAVVAGLIAILGGIALGTVAGVRRNRWPDHLARLFAISGASTPTFWFGLLLLIPLYVGLALFPLGRATPEVFDSISHPTGLYTVDSLLNLNVMAFGDALWHLALPAVTLGFSAMAIIVRMMRSSMVEKMSEEYVEAARAKGLPERLVITRHARRNALVPTSTVIGLSFGFLLQGSVVVELIFRWPGIGQWVTDAILAGDQATIMAYVLVTALIFMTVNLAVDVAYAYLDRRVVLGSVTDMTVMIPPNANVPQVRQGRMSATTVRAKRLGEVSREVLRNPLTLLGLVLIAGFLLMAAFAPLLTEANTPDPYQTPRDWQNIDVPPGVAGHVLGTDSTGGDVLYGLIWGSRLSLQLSLTVVITTVVIGTIVGSIAGMVGGKFDTVLMRIVDVFLSIPELIFALAIAAVLGPSFRNIILALAVVFWVKYARIIRGEILSVRQNEYVAAATVVGDSRWNVYRKDVLPNAITPIVVQATLDMGNVVLIGAGLSFIGLAQAGLTEWGAMVSAGQSGIIAGQWWVSTFAGLAIFLWALAFNLVGDGLRDVLDPKTEGR